MNDINEMPPVCAYCPYWEVCKPPYICPDIGDEKPKRTEKRTETHACDLISRAAVIDALEKIDCSDGVGISSLKCDAVDDAVTAIKALPSAQPGWTPWDSGKFPKESGYYIVTAYDGCGSRVTFAKYQKSLKRWELTGARAYWRVLAWMPLPEPYSERRQE